MLSTARSKDRLERELARVLASGECCLECQYAGSNRCDCPCEGRYHGIAVLLG